MSLFSAAFIVFMTILVALYYLLPKKFQWFVLLAASATFYLASGWQGMIFILVTVISQYLLALALERKNAEMAKELASKELDGKQTKQVKQRYAAKKKRYVLFSVLINLGILCFFKFADSAATLIDRIFGMQAGPLEFLVPLGLSYYTFKSIGYVIDVYRGRVKAQRNILKLALFISYFPALLQGPIDRYEDLADQLVAEHSFEYRRFTFGLQRMLWGYIKKLVIAERITVIVNAVVGSYVQEGYVGFIMLAAMALYGFEIYADFSGGIDVVCGLSEIFGISMTENFRRPFFAASVAEYWQRWHITLGAWMRTYVFYPLSLSPTFNKLGKKCRKTFGDRFGKLIAPSIASFITFFLVGMWHGVGWNYVMYALYNAFFVSTGTLFENVYAKGRAIFKINEEWKLWRLFQMVRTFFIVMISRYMGLAKDVEDILLGLRAAFTHFNPGVFFDGSFFQLGLSKKNLLVMALSIIGLVIVDYIQERGIPIRETIAKQNIILRWCIYYAAIFGLLIFGMYGPGYDAASFVYEQF